MKKRRVRRKPSREQPVRIPYGALRRPEGERLLIEVFNEVGTWPYVHITSQAHGKIRAIVEACPIEVSWLSPVIISPEGNASVVDVLVPKQMCGVGYTEITTDGEGEMLSGLMANHEFMTIKSLACWGHSHVNFSVSPSGVDTNQTHDFVERMAGRGKSHFIRLIANKHDDLFASLYLLREGLAYHNVPLRIEPPETERWREWAKNEVEQKVTWIKVPTPTLFTKAYLYGKDYLAYLDDLSISSFENTVKLQAPDDDGGRKT